MPNPGTQIVPHPAAQFTAKPKIGGPFTLTDHTGKRVTEKDFLGKYMVVYFGYSYCPDVCPTELQVIVSALDKLGAKGEKITPLFITIDPERDTVEQMASYVGHFHKNLIGLTGSPEEIRQAARAYKVYYAKAKNDDPGKERADSDYLMNHSNIIYVMDPNGAFAAHFIHATDPGKLAGKLAKLLS